MGSQAAAANGTIAAAANRRADKKFFIIFPCQDL
jgi:hypothetical protein